MGLTIPELFSIGKDIIISITTTIAEYCGFKGRNNWRREQEGKASFELARNYLKSVYQLRNRIVLMRDPFMPDSEFPDDFNNKPAGEHSDEERAKAHGYAYDNRQQKIIPAINEFEALSLEAEVLWGGDIKEKAQKLLQCVSTLQASLMMYIDNMRKHDIDTSSDLYKEIRNNVYAINENNPFTLKINAVVKELEDVIRLHLRKGK